MGRAKLVIGSVSAVDYEIRVVDESQNDVCYPYNAGNHRLDSGLCQSLPSGHFYAMTKSELFQSAKETAEEIAEEYGLDESCIDVRYGEDW